MVIKGNSTHIPLKDNIVQCVVTSPPYYGLRDYGISGQLGLEPTIEEYINNMVHVFREVMRVLRPDGVCLLNLGDSYFGSGSPGGDFRDGKGGDKYLRPYKRRGCGLKPKDLIGIPWRVAFALQADGWWLRQDIVWHKPNPMPESVKDRCAKSHEYVFLLTKSARYFWDGDAIGQNKKSVWTIPTQSFRGAHFATFPEKLVEPCVLAGSRIGDIVLDPFAGSCTTGVVSERYGRKFVGVELNMGYIKLGMSRMRGNQMSLISQ